MKIRRSDRAAAVLIALSCAALALPCRAQDAPSSPPPSATEPPGRDAPEDEATVQAREAFIAGAQYVRATKWGEALTAFERSAAIKPHAVTTFNIGYCERALGQYTRAHDTFTRALTQGELPQSLAEETRGYLAEMDRLFVRATATVAPKDVMIAVDGRPLRFAGLGVMTAGVEAPGDGQVVPVPKFVLVLNPGAHVLTLRRKGFADAVINKSFPPGSRPTLDLTLARLPATLEITASQPGAAVQVEGIDVGLAPLALSRPQGSYRVLVQKPDYDAYEARVDLEPGETTRLRATLALEETSFYETWWFWTGTAAVIGGVVLTTYLLTRPDAERPPLTGGGLGWSVEVP